MQIQWGLSSIELFNTVMHTFLVQRTKKVHALQMCRKQNTWFVVSVHFCDVDIIINAVRLTIYETRIVSHSAATLALPYLVFDEVLHKYGFLHPPGPLPMVMQSVMHSPGAGIHVTMCHMLCPQRLPSLARCSLCHWFQHLYKLHIFWALQRQGKHWRLAQYFDDACRAVASSTKSQRYKKTWCPNWQMQHAVHVMHN